MGKAEDIARKHGGNILASIGARMETPPPPIVVADQDIGRTRSRDAGHVDVERIIPDPDQPRKHFDMDELHRLAETAKVKGILQPVRLRWRAHEGRWVLIVGERRWRAAKLAGLRTIPAIFMSRDMTEVEVLEEQIIENEHRSNFQPIEQAQAYRRVMDLTDRGVREMAAFLHIAPSTVSRALALLETPAEVQALVASGRVPPSVALGNKDLSAEEQAEKASQAAAKRSGIARPRLGTSRIFQVAGGTVTVRLRSLTDTEAPLMFALEEAIAQLHKEAPGKKVG